ncbi:MAG: tRNA (N6-threonylcarbamoyladenosine(37)-N6)-methyltransferase TrmO [Bacteroidetes bacterium]|nr:MAG: tRNA (N6-threonylcarbamoyladenosine(37)-N6)-methyltransferase TrmO [Bacteroidota bacterium]
MNEVRYNPIGIIHSPFKDIKGMPIQSASAKGVIGTIEINHEYAAGLKDLDGFSHIMLIYHFHLTEGFSLRVRPFMDDNLRGVFATRAPRRPNPIGISVVKLVKIENNILHIEEVDIVDNTPLLDIKPYVPDFDSRKAERIGWLSGKSGRSNELKSDNRFR